MAQADATGKAPDGGRHDVGAGVGNRVAHLEVLMGQGGLPRDAPSVGLGFAAGVVLGFALLGATLWWWPKPAAVAARQAQPTLEELKRIFARPTFVPAPADNPATPAKLA